MIDPQNLALFLALGGTLCFASSSLVFTEYSKRLSVLWMNCFKATVAFVFLIPTVIIFTGINPISSTSFAAFFASGLIGLNLGDLLLLAAFTRLGPARTLILFGFQPLFVGIAAFLLFDQELDLTRLSALFFLILCLLSFSIERFRRDRHWGVTGLTLALAGVILDTTGVLLTRAAFEISPLVTPIEGHFYRCLGALAGFVVLSRFSKIELSANFLKWDTRGRALLLVAALAGTYLSLILYLSAVRIGHLASIAAVGITGPMFATILECVVYRRWPSRYLLVALAFFCAGFYILFRTA